MTPTPPQYGSDSELQADVMRFMAIIAFCLIAILALVRNVTPEKPAATQAAADTPVEEPATESIVAVDPPRSTTRAAAPPSRPPPARPSAERPIASTEPAPPQTIEAPRDRPPPVAEPAAEPPATAQPAAEPPATQSPGKDEGLILRFASDSDFLRLIARGDIQVYAYRERDVLTLSESYQFLETRAPGQVYELLPASIPSLIVDALRRSRSELDSYRWGVALPGRISHQIESYVHEVKSGQLVIDRFGDVHHVAAS